MTTLSAREISTLCRKTDRAIRKRAARENWQGIECTSQGGTYLKYDIGDLPQDIQSAYYNKVISDATPNVAPATPNVAYPTPPPPATIPTQPAGAPVPALRAAAPVPAITIAQQDRALAKAGLYKRYAAAIERAPRGSKVAARREFCEAYNSGVAFPSLFKMLGRVSWQTIEGWRNILARANGDSFALADQRGHCHKGRKLLSREQQEIVLKCALNPNKPRLAEAIRMAWSVMHAQGIKNGQSMSTYRRFLNEWRSVNNHIWVYTREGAKAWNDKCAYYLERDYSRINVGDIVVADGHVMNFEILNPFTGRPKRMILILWYDMKSNFPLGWEIMPTENTAAISSALRRAILRLGKIPQIAYLDNGKAFRARFFEGSAFDENAISCLWERLGMRVIHAWPYHGQSKTVERFFGSFAELERWCPTYTGTSIENKPPRMMRGERMHRRVYDRIMGTACITLEQAHGAVAAWFDAYSARPQQDGHLKGLTPFEIFSEGRGPGIEHYQLSSLMMAEADRMVHRNGIRFLGRNFYDPALHGYTRPVTIRYDLQDLSCVYVFDADERFLCRATETVRIHPAASHLGTPEDQSLLSGHIEMKKRMEKEASVCAREFLEYEVLPEHRRQIERIGLSLAEKPSECTVSAVKVIPQMARKIDQDRIAEGEAIEAARKSEREQIEAACARALTGEGQISDIRDLDRYCCVYARWSSGESLTPAENDFMVFFGRSEIAIKYADLFEKLGIDALTAAQQQAAM